jgi:hypothetical protein
MKAASKFAKNKAALSRELDLSRPTIHKALLLPGAPKKGKNGYDIGSVQHFIATRSGDIKTTSELDKARLRLIAIRERREELELQIRAGEFEREIHDRFFSVFQKAHQAMRTVLLKMPDDLSPRFVGCTASEIRKLFNRKLVDTFEEVRAAVHKACKQAEADEKKQEADNVVAFAS